MPLFSVNPSRRGLRRLLAGLVPALSVAVVAGLTLPAPADATTAPAVSGSVTSSSTRPGTVGHPITLASNTQLSGYDAGTDASGRSYVGWIANATSAASRTIYLCTLLPGATSCHGGTQSVPSLGPDSATGLKVLVSPGGTVTLVWFHDTSPGSIIGTRGGRITTSISVAGGPLSAPTDVADAPSFGQLFDARLQGGSTIWTAAGDGLSKKVEVRHGFVGSPTTLTAPFLLATAQLAFSGSTTVLGVQQYGGSITTPTAYTYLSGSWHPFRSLANTWNVANLGLASTASGVRLVGVVGNASYRPVVSRWTGSSFAAPTFTGDTNNCTPLSHDPVSDASGRMADVSGECSQIAVANFADTVHATTVRFSAGGTLAQGIPQITTTPRGRAWVAWSVDNTGTTSSLRVVSVRLPGMTRTVKAHSKYGKIKLIGPASCLPAVDVAVSAKAKGRHGWKAGKARIRLGHKSLHGVLPGASLAAGKTYRLKATSVLHRHRHRGKHKIKVALTFRTCPAP